MGPFKITSRGNRFVMTLMCAMSGFAMFVALKEKTALAVGSVAQTLQREWSLRFGTPEIVISAIQSAK